MSITRTIRRIPRQTIRSINDLLTITVGQKLGLVHVNEYPKCGGTWVSRLIRSYYRIPHKYGTTCLVRPNAVILKHDLYTPYFNKPIIVIRDPRDVWVSYFFYEIYNHKGTYKEVVLNGYDENLSDKENLSQYIKEKTAYPEHFKPKFSYIKFIESWLDKKDIFVVKYENVHKDPEGTLRSILEHLGEDNIDSTKIKSAIEENTFKNITGRKAGNQDKFSHKRKGVVGDWKNYFNQESSAFVQKTQQELLVKLGYEQNDTWAKRFL